MEGERNHAECEHADAPHGKRNLLRIPGEDAHKHAARKLADKKHRRGEHKPHAEHPDIGTLDAVNLFGAVIEAEDGLRAACEAGKRHRDDLHAALHNRGAGDIGIAHFRPAVPLQHGIEHDEKDAVRGGDDKRGKTVKQHTAHDAPIVTAKGEAHMDFLSQQHTDDKHEPGRL